MGRRRESEKLQKVTLNLYMGDFDYLQSLESRLGAGKIIRELTRNYIRKVQEQAALRKTPDVEVGEI